MFYELKMRLVAVAIVTTIATDECVSFDWSVQEQCKHSSVQFPSDTCITGHLNIDSYNSNHTFKSTRFECAGRGCVWKCWNGSSCDDQFNYCILDSPLLPCVGQCFQINTTNYNVTFDNMTFK